MLLIHNHFHAERRFNGIGFAIPADCYRYHAELIDHGQVVRGWIGVETQPLTDELARSFGVNKNAGVLISGVYRKGPAADANIFSEIS